ncbi:MAG TPA: hypothetical protein EYP24_00410 [bacterium (Candidatus Stahlbacteria)]|nr:hypothetical protein [Candidatus Stahlbacteria bacterium]
MKGVKSTFDNFIPGEENRVTFLAAQKIARAEPGALFNPFYIYGDIGTGKTHLLEAISGEIDANLPGYITVFEKIGNIVEELKTTGFEEIQDRITNANFLIMDDIHYLSRLEEDQDRLVNLIVKMFNRDVQIILSARCAPKGLKLDEHFVSIIESGLVCSLVPPKEMTRMEITKKMCEIKGVILSDEIFAELARIPFKSVRELEGALNRVLAYSSIGEIAIDHNLLMMALKEYYQERQIEPVVSTFLEEVTEEVNRALAEVESEEAIRKQFEEKIYIWNMKGFRTDPIQELLNKDIESLKKGYEDFLKKIKTLVDLQRAYGALDLSNNPELALKIEGLLFDPQRIEELKCLIDEAKGITPVPRFPSSFDDLVVGDCNRIPIQLARKAIQSLGQEINPLTIIGGAGTGKTSLLYAIGNDILTRNPKLKVSYFDFKHRKGGIPIGDVLLIDNLDSIDEAHLEEFITVLQTLIDKKSQVIITSTKPPLRFDWLEEARRLFEEGVEAELKPPDTKTAQEYIKVKVNESVEDLPSFESFYDLERYSKIETQPFPLGLPGEGDVIEVTVDEDKFIYPGNLDDLLLDEEAPWQ